MTTDPDHQPHTAASRTRATVLWAVVGAALLMLALVFRVEGRAFGLGLLYGGVTALILAAAHRWRRPGPFVALLVAGAIGFPVFSILHNGLWAMARLAEWAPLLRWPLEALQVASFMIALFVCPPAVVVGALGAVATLIAGRRRAS